jgi:hypothetical protein
MHYKNVKQLSSQLKTVITKSNHDFMLQLLLWKLHKFVSFRKCAIKEVNRRQISRY